MLRAAHLIDCQGFDVSEGRAPQKKRLDQEC
jgi:hypothetical protein